MIIEPLEPPSLLPDAVPTDLPPGGKANPPCAFAAPRRRAGQFLGATVLRICRGGRQECTNTNCWLQPVCACARADLAAAHQVEARVWALIALCGGLVIVFAAIWGMW